MEHPIIPSALFQGMVALLCLNLFMTSAPSAVSQRLKIALKVFRVGRWVVAHQNAWDESESNNEAKN